MTYVSKIKLLNRIDTEYNANMKRVYLVRHGESESNVSGIAAGPESPLTTEGERQAAAMADRVSRIDIDIIISSPYLRTKETARIINEIARKPIEYSDLFVEKRNPTEHLGKMIYNPADTRSSEHFTDPNWKHSDEDNFTEIKTRALAALEYLLRRPEENILVVSHGWFLRVFIAAQLFGETLTINEYTKMWRYLATRNTGLTLVEHDENNLNGGWRLITWNDHAHLG